MPLLKQRGAAIIVALFVTSLVAIAAIAMIERLRINLRSTELIANNIRAQFLAQGSLAWAMEQLNTNWQQKKPNQLIDLTPISSPIDHIEDANVSSVIFDAQGRFNLNNLSDPASQTDFSRLITLAYPKISLANAKEITLAIANWITPGAMNNTLDGYYAKAIPPYRAAHQPMVSVSELRLIKGVTAELYAALAPYVTALPDKTSINVNNTSIPVLMSLSPNLTVDAAKAIIMRTKKTPFLTIDQFQQFDVVKNNPMPTEKITVISNYFLVKSMTKIGEQKARLNTLLVRTVRNNRPIEIVVWQSKG